MKRFYLRNFNWALRVKSLAFSKEAQEYDRIEIDPGGGCMESRDLEQWNHLGFGFFICKRKNLNFWLDKDLDYSQFEFMGINFSS